MGEGKVEKQVAISHNVCHLNRDVNRKRASFEYAIQVVSQKPPANNDES